MGRVGTAQFSSVAPLDLVWEHKKSNSTQGKEGNIGRREILLKFWTSVYLEGKGECAARNADKGAPGLPTAHGCVFTHWQNWVC